MEEVANYKYIPLFHLPELNPPNVHDNFTTCHVRKCDGGTQGGLGPGSYVIVLKYLSFADKHKAIRTHCYGPSQGVGRGLAGVRCSGADNLCPIA